MTLTTLPSGLPALRLSATAMPLSRIATSSLATSLARGGARRAYWSFRCAKRSPYQYWITASPSHQKAWQRRGTMGSGASSFGGSKYKQPEKPEEKKDPTKKEETTDRENRVQADEQRFLAEEWAEWEKAARRHADARLELLRRAMERDPYNVFFGGREARGVWNPWKHGIGGWGKMLERWNQKSRSLTEYVEGRGGSLAKRWGDESEWTSPTAKTTGEDGYPAEQKTSIQEKSSSTVRKTERKDGRTIETEETKMKDGRTIRMRETEERNGQTIRTETTETSQSTTIPSVQSGDVHIDLITMRKVQRIAPVEQSTQASRPAPQLKPSKHPKEDEALDIPIKTFKSQTATGHTMAGFASQEWLKREGFSSKDNTKVCEKYHPVPPPKPQSPAPKAVYVPPLAKPESNVAASVSQPQSTQVQSALDRRPPKESLPVISEKEPASAKETSKKYLVTCNGNEGIKDQLVYEPKENTTDDVDLLRASDIRAASGKVKERRHQPSTQEVIERRNALSSRFAESQRQFELELRREIIDALKNDSIPTKSPLWAMCMLYAREGQEDYQKRTSKGQFSLQDPQDLQDMQSLSHTFFNRMHSPKKVFASDKGTNLSRYLDANRASLALGSVQSALDRWHEEMQSVLKPRGVQPFSLEILEYARKAFRKYHIELRRQILSGTGPEVIHTKDTKEQQRREAADKMLAKEVASTRSAMQQHEEKQPPVRQSDRKADFVQWTPPGLTRNEGDLAKAATEAHQGAKLSRELQHIYEAEYGKITASHRQPVRESEASSVPEVKETRAKPVSEQEPEGQRFVWDESEPMKAAVSKAEVAKPRVSPKASSKPEVSTILLTLGRRTGDLTTHPTAQWPVLKSQPSTTGSPLDSPAVCAFLQVAASPQQVLREVVSLQAKGYRLTSGRKGCLIFQQVPSIDTTVTSEAENQIAHATPVIETTQSTSDVAQKETFAPVEAETQSPATSTAAATEAPVEESTPTPIPSVTSNQAFASRPYVSSTATSTPSPTQPIRRAEAVFSGRPASSTESISQYPSHSYSSAPPSSSSSSSPPPPPPPPSYINNHHYYRGSRRSGRRGVRHPRRRFRHVVFHVLRTALLMASAAYVAGLWLEWRRERAQREQRAQRSRITGPLAPHSSPRRDDDADDDHGHDDGWWADIKEKVGRGEDSLIQFLGTQRVQRERDEARSWWAANSAMTGPEQQQQQQQQQQQEEERQRRNKEW